MYNSKSEVCFLVAIALSIFSLTLCLFEKHSDTNNKDVQNTECTCGSELIEVEAYQINDSTYHFNCGDGACVLIENFNDSTLISTNGVNAINFACGNLICNCSAEDSSQEYVINGNKFIKNLNNIKIINN